QVSARLQNISDAVDGLAADAKDALEQLGATDQAAVQASLEHGNQEADQVDTDAHAVLAALAGLPGDEPDASLHYGNDALARRAAVLAALDAAAGLKATWLQVATQALQASDLITLLANHDEVVLAAAAQGRSRQYGQAATTLNDAILAVVSVK